jgi:hypothetical protein
MRDVIDAASWYERGKRQDDKMNGNAGSAGSATVEREGGDAGFISSSLGTRHFSAKYI